MTKTLRTSSYFHHMARQSARDLPLLTPPHLLAPQRGTTMPDEIAIETLLPTQRSSSVSIPFSTSREDNRSGLSQQGEHIPHNPKTSSENVVGTSTRAFSHASTSLSPQGRPAKGLEASSLSSPQPSELPVTEKIAPIGRSKQSHVDILLPPSATKSMHTPDSPVVVKHTPETNDQQSHVRSSSPIEAPAPKAHNQQQPTEFLSPPTQSKRIDADTMSGLLPATHATSYRHARASGPEKTAHITLRPLPQQQQERTVATQPDSWRTIDFPGQRSKANEIVSEVHHRLKRQEVQQKQATIHIGSIDIQIVPPAPPAPLPPVRSTTVRQRSTSGLAREMTSFIGLRQG